jgi:hypothetical protein
MDGAEAQTRAGRPDSERPAAQVDVLSANELRLSSSFLSRHLDARAEGGVRSRRTGPKS